MPIRIEPYAEIHHSEKGQTPWGNPLKVTKLIISIRLVITVYNCSRTCSEYNFCSLKFYARTEYARKNTSM